MEQLVIIVRYSVAANLIEFLNSVRATYRYTESRYFDDREVSVFLVTCETDMVQTIYGFCNSAYSSDSVVPFRFMHENLSLLEDEDEH